MIHLTYAALYDGELTFDSVLTAARGWGAARAALREYTIGHELGGALLISRKVGGPGLPRL